MSDTAAGDVVKEPWWKGIKRSYSRPEMAGMLLLGFASGLPLYLLYQKTSFWLREEGIELSTIGYFYLVGLFYSFKFVWAPLIDRISIPVLKERFGHRRSWMLAAIAGTMLGLVTISTGQPTESLIPIIAGAVILSFSGASLDISIDAWRIESAPTDWQADMAAAYSLGYRGAYFFSGSGFLVAAAANWNVAFLFMALTMGLVGALVLLIREPQHTTERVDLHDVPLLAGPANAIAVGLALLGLGKVLAWFNAPLPLIGALAGAGALALIAGPVILPATKTNLPWRVAIAALAGVLVFAGPLTEIMFDPESQSISYRLVRVALHLAALGGVIAAILQSMNERRATADASTDSTRGRLYIMFATPFLQVWDRYGRVLIAILTLVMLYRLSDFTMGVMAYPLYVDLGYAKETVGLIQSGPGLASTIFGLFIGGLAVNAFGLTRSLVIGAVITFLTNGFYAWFAANGSGDQVTMLAFAVCADNIAGGFVTTAFIAYLSSLVDPTQAATQYALFSSLYALVNKFAASFSGAIAEAIDWTPFFLLTASYAIPALLLVLFVAWLTKRYPPKALEAAE